MSIDQRPIPPEALPPGWGAAELCDDRFAYRYRQPPIELVADRTTTDRSHPRLGLGYCWELRYRYSLRDRSISEAIGLVSTRRAAVEGLLESMRRVHERAESIDDPFDVTAVLDRISLSEFVPDGRSNATGDGNEA
ncbi:hypothetical protein [Halopiger xanaduensis]|uniref:Uncharacterized protein n=1 Tax=Halopiger xanaduensis (strain DSM 18323 / JCM 14033 / SH-6) TaxID=797210 RepID=F8D2Z0_HALXS|nr:hypothetical protein [Halopiger xanaduensis]AEH36139.1 hypothetical protein Halxa_1507 [Halopiger xanaduensis SH-6]